MMIGVWLLPPSFFLLNWRTQHGSINVRCRLHPEKILLKFHRRSLVGSVRTSGCSSNVRMLTIIWKVQPLLTVFHPALLRNPSIVSIVLIASGYRKEDDPPPTGGVRHGAAESIIFHISYTDSVSQVSQCFFKLKGFKRPESVFYSTQPAFNWYSFAES